MSRVWSVISDRCHVTEIRPITTARRSFLRMGLQYIVVRRTADKWLLVVRLTGVTWPNYLVTSHHNLSMWLCFDLTWPHWSIDEDIDECSQTPGPCSYRCHNLPGGYLCSCPPGHALLADRKSCAGLVLPSALSVNAWLRCMVWFCAVELPPLSVVSAHFHWNSDLRGHPAELLWMFVVLMLLNNAVIFWRPAP